MTDQPQPSIETELEGEGVLRRLLRPANRNRIGAIILLTLIELVLLAVQNPEGFGNFIRVLRDIFIIVLALQGILISTALVILILQVSALVSLLREEIKPIVKETRETLATVRGTATFVSQNVTQPVIRTAAFVAGARTVVGELAGLRRNLRHRK